MRPILVTGFAAFGEHVENPSEQVVHRLCAGAELVAEVLPVSYRRAEARLRALIEASEPRAMLLLGLYAGEAFRLERVARNRDEAEARDEDGEVRSGRPISACGPAEHASTLPLAAFAEALTGLSLPVVWSSDAGGFLCNHAFYVARDLQAQNGRDVPCGFLHLPPLSALPLERQIEGVAACIEILRVAC